jgi:hypothetical protein
VRFDEFFGQLDHGALARSQYGWRLVSRDGDIALRRQRDGRCGRAGQLRGPGRHGAQHALGGGFAVSRVGVPRDLGHVHQEQQLLQAVDTLLQRDQQIGQGNAGAAAQRQAPDLEHHVFALVQHHEQVARVVRARDVAIQVARIFIQVPVDLDVLHQERRIEVLDLAVAVHQARLQAQRADAARQCADRIEQALERDHARAPRVRVSRDRRTFDHMEQRHPVGIGHRADPFEIVLAVQHLVECIGQVQVFQCRRQETVRNAAFQLGDETIVRQDADVAVQAGMAALFKQRGDVAAQRPGLVGISLEKLGQRPHGLGRIVHGLPHPSLARAQMAYQLDQQVDVVTVGVDSFERSKHEKN